LAVLVSRGRSVIVLDRGSIGSGMTARTTAHLATALDDYYKEFVSVRGEECARLYYQSVMAAISRYKRRSRQPWSTTDVNKLKQLAKGNTPAGVMSVKLQRPIATIRSKAQREGISLRPVNRSPYSRRAKTAKRG
jgi:glycine/D-amino acid oxidase-like deaminating enzyme